MNLTGVGFLRREPVPFQRLPTTGLAGTMALRVTALVRDRASPPAAVPSPPWEEDVIVHSSLDSLHLAGNLLGDPSERDLFVYLPPGYEATDRGYPTAYLLHALGDSAASHVTPKTDGPRWAAASGSIRR